MDNIIKSEIIFTLPTGQLGFPKNGGLYPMFFGKRRRGGASEDVNIMSIKQAQHAATRASGNLFKIFYTFCRIVVAPTINPK